MIFEDQTINALQTLPNADAHFAHYLTKPASAKIRNYISEVSNIAPASLVLKWKEALHSLNNAKSTLAFSEIVALLKLKSAGWTISNDTTATNEPNQCYKIKHEDGREANLLTVSIIQQPSPKENIENRATLRRVLNRIESKKQIAIILRRPLPGQFDPGSIRLSISRWLEQDPEPNTFAYYKDQNIWLEIGTLKTPVTDDNELVAFIQGPLRGDTVWEHMNEQVEKQIQAQISKSDKTPCFVNVGANHRLPLLKNSLQFALYGPLATLSEHQTSFDENPGIVHRKHTFDTSLNMGWFQKEIAQNVIGLLMHQLQDNEIQFCGYQNPWCIKSFQDFSFPKPVFQVEKMEENRPVLVWDNSSGK